jgi:4-amino-4-deoxy-L-arabinose transferase-like glycosyltransferase
MITITALLSFLPSTLIGFLLVTDLWDKRQSISYRLPLKLALSVGLGFATSSCLVFVWIMTFGQLSRGVFVLELMLLVGLGIILVRRSHRGLSPAANEPDRAPAVSRRSPYLLRSVLCVASVSEAVRFCYVSRVYPHGQYDASATWNTHARFLFRGAQHWKQLVLMANADYPLLVPACVARSWELLGRETQLIPILFSFLFTFATIGLVATSLTCLRGERQGLLAGLALLGTPFFIFHGASQYADVPFSFFLVATVVLLFLHAASPSETNYLVLAGMSAAAAAWTKNEGTLFLLLLLLLYPLVAIWRKGKKQCGRELLALLVGAAPISSVLFAFKMFLASRNDVMSQQAIASTIPKLLDLSRYHLVIHWFLLELPRFGLWNPYVAMPVLFVSYFLLLGICVRKKEACATTLAVLLPILMSIGYFFVYIISPFDLTWHLQSSLNRLLLQLWPLVVFAYFAVVRAPEQAWLAKIVPTQTSNA